LRDRIRQDAEADGSTFAEVIASGLDLLEKEQFWNEIATITPDEAYRSEFLAWDADDNA